jgi:hypothetical protein
VKGIVVPVETGPAVVDAYDDWNADYCNPDKANAVAVAIHGLIDTYLAANPDIQYLVIAGADDILPFYRLADDTAISNEREFAFDSRTKFGTGTPENSDDSPLFWALNNALLLTDNFYADDNPQTWFGRQLYVPDRAIGRLVETPAEIGKTIDQYLALPTDKTITIGNSLVTGYDFLSDGATAISDELTAFGASPDTLISPDWSVAELIAAWQSTTAPNLVSLNAHFEHWRGLPAAFEPPLGLEDLFINADVTNPNYDYTNQIIFSMGCHAGFSVPQASLFTDTDPSQPDFAQAYAGSGAASYVANTGYGYGMDDAVAASEQLMLFFTQEMGADSSVSLGQALVAAKQRYIGGAASGGLGVYDDKVVSEATMYGLPMVKVHMPSTDTPSVAMALSAPSTTSNSAVTANQSAPVADGDLQTINLSVQLDPELHTTADGDYYALAGEIQVFPGRPVQPRGSVVADEVPGYSLHGALFLGGNFFVDDNGGAGFNPLIAVPITDSQSINGDPAGLPEPQFDKLTLFPSKFWGINFLGGQDRVVLVGGQFLPDHVPAEWVYTDMELQTYYAPDNSNDFAPPSIRDVNSQFGGSVDFFITAEDPSGVARVIVTYLNGNAWESANLNFDPDNFVWTGHVEGIDCLTPFFVQAVDNAGNVAFSDNIGLPYLTCVVRPNAVNPVGQAHTFAIKVQVDNGDGLGFVPYTNTAGVVLGHSGVGSITSENCSGNMSTGQCTVEVNSNTPGNLVLGATWVGDLFTDQGTAVQVDGRIDTVVKTYVDAGLTITPATAADVVGTQRTFTIHATQDTGSGLTGVSGITPTVTFGGLDVVADNCATLGTDANGDCTVVVNSDVPGVFQIQATAEITVLGSLFQTEASATQTYVDATLVVGEDGVVEVGQSYIVSGHVDVDTGAGPTNAPDGTVIDFSILSGSGVIQPSCTTSGGTGSCPVTFSSSTPGITVISGTASVTVNNLTFTRSAVAPVTVRTVDARIRFTPPLAATNGLGEAHTFVVTVEQNDGTGWSAAPDGTLVTFSLDNPDAFFVAGNTCATTGGSCSIQINSSTAGSITVHAGTTLGVSGLALLRSTGTGGENSADAVKTYIPGSLSWLKQDDQGQLLGGAIFEVCRTHDRFGVDIADECMSVVDNTPPDANLTGGEFLLTNLKLGRYTVQETAAPAGYLLSSATQTADLTIDNPSGAIGVAFVNQRTPFGPGKIAPTQTTCQDFINGTAGDLTEVAYGVKQGKINNTAPGVFFYYTSLVAPAPNFTVQIIQTKSDPEVPFFNVQGNVLNDEQMRLFNADCSNSALGVFSTENGQVTLNVTDAAVDQVFVISVKYDTSSVVGTSVSPPFPTFHYDFATQVDGTQVDQDADGLDLKKKP